ncbi:hypothetical protein C791_8093 [Amycolatopsis azurea DSM 43854]|uniref:Uncharacterized protein n=1 Tax=Amycolatopsis azurea DSM 43854 TaxID=1238180 RepID=M2PEI5_9PSEU|nr:hypothetical protein C791_8093 [Amycolatopsis azurea DSM 43854]
MDGVPEALRKPLSQPLTLRKWLSQHPRSPDLRRVNAGSG